MPKTVISVENLSKHYRLGVIGGATFREEFSRFWARKLGRPDPWARVGQPDHGNRDGEHLWALRGVNLEVKEGEILGIIGRNGAGKSTLLKILSRITAPTSGRAVIRGRVGSLLEVGTGFHHELTGRENIYLNGTILGMRREEVTRKLDEIVEFAEISQFIDTPVKRYSSGMTVRLAFAVAAHLEPEILIVDEVLAVGDVAFQQKCLGKMDEVASTGRTILFVSHNLGAVANLCGTVALLIDGRVSYLGSVSEGIKSYLEASSSRQGALVSEMFSGSLRGVLSISGVQLNQDRQPASVVSPGRPFGFTVTGYATRDLANFDVTLSIFREGTRLFSCHDAPPGVPLAKGVFTSEFEIPPYTLRPGRYSVAVGARRIGSPEWIWGTDVLLFDVAEQWDVHLPERDYGLIQVKYSGKRYPQQVRR